MPENTPPTLQFASCASRVELLEGVMCVVAAMECLIHWPGWIIALPFAFGAVWLFARSRRDWRRPYVEVRDEQFVIHSGRKESHSVDRRPLAGVRRGWNSTILVLKDGTQVPVDHGLFATTAEANRFTEFVEGDDGTVPA